MVSKPENQKIGVMGEGVRPEPVPGKISLVYNKLEKKKKKKGL